MYKMTWFCVIRRENKFKKLFFLVLLEPGTYIEERMSNHSPASFLKFV